jgi:hypothetical protein
MIDRFVVPLVITALFCVGIVQCLYVLAAQQASWGCRISTLLHFVMSLAMIVMAWSAGTHLPTIGPMVFFGVAAAWFVAMAITDASGVRQRLTRGYHAVMMTAMGWMFAAIHTGPSAGQSGHSHGHDAHASSMHTLSTIDASSTELPPRISEPGWVTTVNGIAALGFAVATVYWLRRFVAEGPPDPGSHEVQLARPELLCQTCLAAGAAIMFGVMV